MTKQTVRRRDYRKLRFLGLLVFVAVFSFAFLAQRKIENDTNAANLANFQAGYIISDSQMTDYNSMSETEIQDFLWAKGKCYNTDFRYVGTRSNNFSDSTPPTTWHVIDGHTVCLAEERINGESAAHIIWQAAQDYKINPKVLIVLLQKETGLITDPIPNSWDYQRAAGYGCPDTAACSERYYGLKNQIRNAAYLFRIVMDGNSSYYPIGDNYIQYNPNAGCGGSVVHIQNLATSALYRYTPYQPNAAALAVGYGSAYCGAYGNRNFYSYFEDWFGNITDEGVLEMPESSSIIEGEYTIKSALGNNVVVDVSGGSAADGANIQVFASNETAAQKWQIASDGQGSYIIKNASFGKVLDVVAGSTKNGANVQTFSFNDSCAQKWRIAKNSDNTYTIYSLCSGRALDVAGGSSNNGTNIQMYKSNGTLAQKWILAPVRTVGNGDYTIETISTAGNVIDIVGGAKEAKNSTNVQVHADNQTSAQEWRVTYGDDGYYTILNPVSGKVLDVRGAGTTDGTNVQLYESNGSCAQKWQIVKKDKDNYVILSACSGLALAVSGGNVQINTTSSDSAQKWHFAFIQPIEEGEYTIQSSLGIKMVIDVAYGASINGTNIQLFESNQSLAQKWQLVWDNNDGTYIIKNLIDGKVLDVAGAGTYDGANVNLFEQNNSCAQKWKIMQNSDKTYSLYSTCSGKALDVAYGRAGNGANIQLFSGNGSGAQKWSLINL